jgi:hypothetical protein
MKKKTKSTKKRVRSNTRETVIYDNAEERLERTAATETMNWATRRRAIAALVILGGAIGIGFLIRHYYPSKENQTGIIGLNIQKQQECYQDADCPDSAYCGATGYCIPEEMEPSLEAGGVLGRGRGGEGSNVYLSSNDRRGQQ